MARVTYVKHAQQRYRTVPVLDGDGNPKHRLVLNRDGAAEAIRELAEAKRESAQNIVDGFGHETSTSDELSDVADQLDTWADEIESTDVPEDPDPDEECVGCGGTGELDPDGREDAIVLENGNLQCPECGGEGRPKEATEAQLDEWRSEVESATSIIDESPL